uniref:HDC04246 n=1 Tax=Drosophila melanogaster TaxID=7227 RepID=Q6IGY7_DROME|nr:TPA_inf: HDC04246 [Drosophila melanogaster]
MGYTLVLGLSSGSNRRSINKQAFPSRPGSTLGTTAKVVGQPVCSSSVRRGSPVIHHRYCSEAFC